MNQIICTSNINLINIKENPHKNNKKKNWFKFEFSLLTILSLCLLVYYVFFRYDLYTYEKLSQDLAESFEITKIYQNGSDYNSRLLNYETYYYEDTPFLVIGIIEIEKLNVSYPILSSVSKDALKISPCRFLGPMPNEVR